MSYIKDEKVGLECQDNKAAEILDRSVYCRKISGPPEDDAAEEGTHIINNSGTA